MRLNQKAFLKQTNKTTKKESVESFDDFLLLEKENKNENTLNMPERLKELMSIAEVTEDEKTKVRLIAWIAELTMHIVLDS